MIDHSNMQPVVRLGAGFVSLERGWLTRCLREAAADAGYDSWWLAEEVAVTLAAHFRVQEGGGAWSYDGFALTVRGMLAGIGYEEVASHFLKRGVEVGYSLRELAGRVTPGFELGFFEECQRLARQVEACPWVKSVALVETIPAIKRVLRRKQWGERCERFREEMVCFFRSQFGRVGRGVPFSLVIR